MNKWMISTAPPKKNLIERKSCQMNVVNIVPIIMKKIYEFIHFEHKITHSESIGLLSVSVLEFAH